MVITGKFINMNKYQLVAVVAVLIGFLPSGVSAQSVSVSDIVARMDEIIKEMQTLKGEFDSLSGQVKPTGSVQGASTSKRLTKTPLLGETTDEIGLIQKLLKTDADIYPYQVVSGFFGPKTEEAIKNLQTRFKMNPVGVVGPATTELLEAFFAKYPDDNFPANALASDPRGAKPSPVVAGDSTSAPIPNTTTPPSDGIGTIKAIKASQTGATSDVAVYYKNGVTKEFKVTGTTRPEIVSAISSKSGLSMTTVDALLVFGEITEDSGSDDEETEADDALDAAEEAIYDAEDAIDEADEDGEDVDWAEDTIDEAWDLLEEAEEAYDEEEYEDAIDLAEEAEDTAGDAEDRIDEEEDEDEDDEEEDEEENDEIDRIIAEVEEDSAEITVKFEDEDIDDEEFDVDEEDQDDIIAAVADELDMDEDDVEDLIEFDYGDLDEIEVVIIDGVANVSVEFTSGVKLKFNVDEGDEDDMIADIAEELDMDEDDVEDVIDFVYN